MLVQNPVQNPVFITSRKTLMLDESTRDLIHSVTSRARANISASPARGHETIMQSLILRLTGNYHIYRLSPDVQQQKPLFQKLTKTEMLL